MEWRGFGHLASAAWTGDIRGHWVVTGGRGIAVQLATSRAAEIGVVGIRSLRVEHGAEYLLLGDVSIRAVLARR